MKCEHCGHRYDANLAACYPGGFSAPGAFFYLTLILATVTTVLFVWEYGGWRWLALGITVFTSLQIFISWLSCHGDAESVQTGGETCPECGEKNTIYPWSF